MNPPLKLALFAAALAVCFGVSFLLGSAIQPL